VVALTESAMSSGTGGDGSGNSVTAPSRSDSSQAGLSGTAAVPPCRRRFTAPHIAVMLSQSSGAKIRLPPQGGFRKARPVKAVPRGVDSFPISFVVDDSASLKFGTLRLSKNRAWIDGAPSASAGSACIVNVPLQRLTLIRLEATLDQPHGASLFFAPALETDPTDSGESSPSSENDNVEGESGDDDVIVVIGGEDEATSGLLMAPALRPPVSERVCSKLRLAFEEHGSLLDSCLRLESLALAIPARADLRNRPSSLFVFA
jgi:hypothetical protein